MHIPQQCFEASLVFVPCAAAPIVPLPLYGHAPARRLYPGHGTGATQLWPPSFSPLQQVALALAGEPLPAAQVHGPAEPVQLRGDGVTGERERKKGRDRRKQRFLSTRRVSKETSL